MSDIADKIRKLIAKAQGTTNPTEAALFMNKATELMAANNLTMEAVDLAAIKESSIKSRFSVSKPKDYELTLMHAISSSFGCSLLWGAAASWMKHTTDGNYASIVFVGPKDRLDLATYAADVLGRQLAKARAEFSSKQSEYYWGVAANAGGYSVAEAKEDTTLRRMIAPRVTKEANSFAIGWVMEIRKKVTRFALNDKEQALLDSYVNDKSGGKEVDNEKTDLSMASMIAGQAAAKDAHLHRPMGHSGEAQSLLGQTLQLGNK